MHLKRKALLMSFRRIRLGSLEKNPEDLETGADEFSPESFKEKGVQEPIQTTYHMQPCFMDDASTVVPTEGVPSPMCSPPPTEAGMLSRVHSLERTWTLTGLEASSHTLSSKTKESSTVLPTALSPGQSCSS